MKFSYQEFDADKLFSGVDPERDAKAITITPDEKDEEYYVYTWVTDALRVRCERLGVDLRISPADAGVATMPRIWDGSYSLGGPRIDDRIAGWTICPLTTREIASAIEAARARTLAVDVLTFT